MSNEPSVDDFQSFASVLWQMRALGEDLEFLGYSLLAEQTAELVDAVAEQLMMHARTGASHANHV